MHKDLRPKEVTSTFLSVEKDIITILYKLFEENPKKKELLSLLMINNKDCLDDLYNNPEYLKIVSNVNLRKLREEGYIKLEPKLAFEEFPQVKSHIVISFDNYVPNGTNPQFRDNIVTFDIICHFDQWQLEDFELRPYRIAAELDTMLNQ